MRRRGEERKRGRARDRLMDIDDCHSAMRRSFRYIYIYIYIYVAISRAESPAIYEILARRGEKREIDARIHLSCAIEIMLTVALFFL